MNKKDKVFIARLFVKLIRAIKSLSGETSKINQIKTEQPTPPFAKGGYVFSGEEKVIPSPFYEERGFAFHGKDKVITIRCCMKCGRELAELKVIEPGEFFTCDTCQQRKEEYLQTFEGKLHEILKSKIPPYDNNLELLPTLEYEILHAFNDETKKITSVRKWTDEDMIDFATESTRLFINQSPMVSTFKDMLNKFK